MKRKSNIKSLKLEILINNNKKMSINFINLTSLFKILNKDLSITFYLISI
jgi:hypothetical protein